MDKVLFGIGDWPVTYGMTTLAAGAVVVLLCLFAVLANMRSGARQAVAAARLAADALRDNFLGQLEERDARIRRLDDQVKDEMRHGASLYAEVAALKMQLLEQNKQAAENLQRVQAVRQQMTDEFKLIAGDVLKSHSETFTRQNREQVDVLLKPLQDKIGEFHAGLLTDRATMSEQIRALAASNLQITTEAGNLTRALKGNSQTQGAWGEMILATILERSGLREGEQFITQQSHAGDDGGRVRTDVEVMMPNEDCIVIDAKVSLTAFEAYVNSEGETREQFLRAHVSSVRTHMRNLGEKSYQRHARSSLDYVMMFVPIESAVASAMTADPKLFEYGMSQGVMLTTPSTLMTVLRTVRNVWDTEKRHRNAEEIAERAGSLYDKVSAFLSTMDKVGLNLERAQQSFVEARAQLSTGRGSVVRQVEMLRELGAKSSRELPKGWESGPDGADASQPAPLNLTEDAT